MDTVVGPQGDPLQAARRVIVALIVDLWPLADYLWPLETLGENGYLYRMPY